MKNLIPLLALLACAHDPQPAAPAATEDLASGDHAFATDLFRELAADTQDNLFLSPTSVRVALAMTWAGADGTTREAMARTLHFPADDEQSVHAAYGAWMADWTSDAERPYDLQVANRLWAQQGFALQAPFQAITAQDYGAEVARLDLQGAPEKSRTVINDWVAERTHDRIPDLLPPGLLGPDSVLVLTNAVYFLGTWQAAFDERMTKHRPFTRFDGSEVDAPTMYASYRYDYAELEGSQVVRLPYKGDRLSMWVVVPRSAEAAPDLDAAWLARARGKLATEEVRLWLPKFEIDASFQLGPALDALGMGVAFTDAADFRRLSTDAPLAISDVVHKAFVKVDEVGTEAAAATAVLIVATSMPSKPPPPPKEVRADHPFLFLIWDDQADAVLFMGRVADPS